MKPIEKNAGYEIVQFENFDKRSRAYIVLGHNPKTDMWVTWYCWAPDDFNIGHYFTNEEAARANYHFRLYETYRRRYEANIED